MLVRDPPLRHFVHCPSSSCAAFTFLVPVSVVRFVSSSGLVTSMSPYVFLSRLFVTPYLFCSADVPFPLFVFIRGSPPSSIESRKGTDPRSCGGLFFVPSFFCFSQARTLGTFCTVFPFFVRPAPPEPSLSPPSSLLLRGPPFFFFNPPTLRVYPFFLRPPPGLMPALRWA